MIGPLKATGDPHIFIEDEQPGYVRYRHVVTGRRWEVNGECTGVATCIVGATLPSGEYVETIERARRVWRELREQRVPDCPVTPEFEGCCDFQFRELESVKK